MYLAAQAPHENKHTNWGKKKGISLSSIVEEEWKEVVCIASFHGLIFLNSLFQLSPTAGQLWYVIIM